jgi:dTDP-4-dehydrorhamnose reductase
MKLLIFGAGGQVARAAGGGVAIRSNDYRADPCPGGYRRCCRCRRLRSNGCDIVINAAGYTAADKEREPAAALRNNGKAPGDRWECARGAVYPHSTDYVFDGAKAAPYLETDAGAAGRLWRVEAGGERRGRPPERHILRTSWVRPPAPTSSTMLRPP